MPAFPKIEFSLPEYQDDTPEILDGMCEYDFEHGQYELLFSIDEINESNAISKGELMKAIVKDGQDFKETLKKYYLPIKNMFLVLQSKSSDLKNIDIKQFADFCATTGVFDEKFKEEDLAKCYIDSNIDDDARLNRSEFIGALLRIAIFKYKETGIEDTITKSFEKLMLEDVLNSSPIAQGIYFRKTNITAKTIIMFLRNEKTL